MARLNEPPIPPQPVSSTETIDAIKRRFLRQNRELAKTNSQQSIRIRSLENDCSRLLGENLSLREQVLQLQNSLEAHASRPSFENIDAVKMKLEAKMAELGGLVAALGGMKKEDNRPRCRSQLAATRRSPDERQWRSGLGLQEVENAMLPTISEDKYYPRRTIGYVHSVLDLMLEADCVLTIYSADELQDILEGQDSQSPDIGPPPVSRFEDEGPIDFNTGNDTHEEVGDEGEPALSINLETRKKRRESGPKVNIRRVSLFESPPEESTESTVTSRTGSKRKFNVQEDEDRVQAKADAFTFSRRNPTSGSEKESSNDEARASSPVRPVLSSSKLRYILSEGLQLMQIEPVNNDPVVSPKKQRSSAQEKSDKPEKPAAPKSRGRPRLNIHRTITPPELPLYIPLEPPPTAEICLDSLPPKTPAVENILSPPTTEPSTSRPESKDTPPPGDLSAADQIGAGRPGRRARPQVSYKEPNLHTKMRRPDAKLVDAVIDRRTSVEPQPAPSTSKPTVRRETLEELGWKPVSAVAGRAVDEEVESGSPLRQKLDRREETKTSPVQPDTVDGQPSASSKAISALISETSTAKRKTVIAPSTKPEGTEIRPTTKSSRDSSIKQEDTKGDNIEVYDFTDSSPIDNPRTRITELAKAARNARRHSALPSSSLPEDRKQEGALPSLHKRTGSGSIKPSSTSSLTKITTSLKVTGVKEKKPSLPASNSSADIKSKIDAAEEARKERETGTLRAERAASRRKSMML